METKFTSRIFRDEKVLKEIIFVDPWLDSNKVEFNDIIVDEILVN